MATALRPSPEQSGAAQLDCDDLEAVYAEYGSRCYALGLAIVRDREFAHDVVQNVFESLARQPSRFTPERGSLSTWLMTVTHHKAVDMVRWQRRRSGSDSGDDGLDAVPASAPTPEDAAVLSSESSRVMAALHQLNPNEREVLVLAYFGGHTQREIGLRTGLPLGTVKSRTLSAMRHMRLHLDSLEPVVA